MTVNRSYVNLLKLALKNSNELIFGGFLAIWNHCGTVGGKIKK